MILATDQPANRSRQLALDAAGLAGVSLITYGVARDVSLGAAAIVLGLILAAAGILGTRLRQGYAGQARPDQRGGPAP